MSLKIRILLVGLLLMPSFLTAGNESGFIHVEGQNLVDKSHQPYFIRGINLGNWLNPEGYMFLFEKTNSYRLIDQAFKELVGEQQVNQFWKDFQENYITREDIKFIAESGMNTIRVPFHYKLFTCQDYMGQNDPKRGFELIDRLVTWCKEFDVHIILDMHDAPGGQTGDNIDDSYGYPWLFEDAGNRQLYDKIWSEIAQHYANESIILGYDLLNEPIAPHFKNISELNSLLEPVYKEVVAKIRKVDHNHIVMLGGAQWDSNFSVFSDWKFDNNMLYTCHRYWSKTDDQGIQDFLDFRTKVNLPLYMGETGENTDEWVKAFRTTLERNNIGWTFWPYKKMKKTSCMVSFNEPKNWDKIVEFTNSDRSSFPKIRAHLIGKDTVITALNEIITNCRFKNCSQNKGYIDALTGK